VLGLEFLVSGAVEFDEPGAIVSFAASFRSDEDVGISSLIDTRIMAGAGRSDTGPAVSRPAGLLVRLGARDAAASREASRLEEERSMTARRSGAPARAPRPPRPAKRDKDFYRLRLYVAGRTARAQSALCNLEAICETHLRGILGDLSNIERLLVGLDLRPLPKKAGP
jgi:hypothetical protein